MRWTVLAALLVTACASSSSDPVSESGSTGSDVATTTDLAPTGSNPAGPSSTGAERTGGRPEGFDTTLARTTLSDGTECEFCVWLADTAQQRSRGLMFVTDLGAPDAMAFRYPDPHTGTFWMKNTLLPLSIAFYAPDGGFLTSFDMEPCTSDPCPNYRTPEAFEIAIEVPQGDLSEFGLVAGSTLELLDLPCGD